MGYNSNPILTNTNVKAKSDFPANLSGPALRALINNKITKMKDLSKYSEKDLLGFHGFGPKGIQILKPAMKKMKIFFKKQEIN